MVAAYQWWPFAFCTGNYVFVASQNRHICKRKQKEYSCKRLVKFSVELEKSLTSNSLTNISQQDAVTTACQPSMKAYNFILKSSPESEFVDCGQKWINVMGTETTRMATIADPVQNAWLSAVQISIRWNRNKLQPVVSTQQEHDATSLRGFDVGVTSFRRHVPDE